MTDSRSSYRSTASEDTRLTANSEGGSVPGPIPRLVEANIIQVSPGVLVDRRFGLRAIVGSTNSVTLADFEAAKSNDYEEMTNTWVGAPRTVIEAIHRLVYASMMSKKSKPRIRKEYVDDAARVAAISLNYISGYIFRTLSEQFIDVETLMECIDFHRRLMSVPANQRFEFFIVSYLAIFDSMAAVSYMWDANDDKFSPSPYSTAEETWMRVNCASFPVIEMTTHGLEWKGTRYTDPVDDDRVARHRMNIWRMIMENSKRYPVFAGQARTVENRRFQDAVTDFLVDMEEDFGLNWQISWSEIRGTDEDDEQTADANSSDEGNSDGGAQI